MRFLHSSEKHKSRACRLTRLKLARSEFLDAGGGAGTGEVAALSCLQDLDVSRCCSAGSSAGDALHAAVLKLAQLTRLCLGSRTNGGGLADDVLPDLSKLQHLRVLVIDSPCLSPPQGFVEWLRDCMRRSRDLCEVWLPEEVVERWTSDAVARELVQRRVQLRVLPRV